jgi:hypothetical protein
MPRALAILRHLIGNFNEIIVVVQRLTSATQINKLLMLASFVMLQTNGTSSRPLGCCNITKVIATKLIRI